MSYSWELTLGLVMTTKNLSTEKRETQVKEMSQEQRFPNQEGSASECWMNQCCQSPTKQQRSK